MRGKNTPFTLLQPSSSTCARSYLVFRPTSSSSKCRGRRSFSSGSSSSDRSAEERPQAPPSTVHRGTQFEHRSRAVLQAQLSMALHRVGGRGDGGVDLQGWWWLPFGRPDPNSESDPDSEAAVTASTVRDADGRARRRVRVLAQCKAERKKLGPNYVREMEGVLHRHVFATSTPFPTTAPTMTTPDRTHRTHTREPVVALLISESRFTRAATLRALSSPVPFLLVHLPPLPPAPPASASASASANDGPMAMCAGPGPRPAHAHEHAHEHTGHVGSVTWNRALSGSDGVLGGEFEIRWERPLVARGAGHGGRPGLWWNGGKVRSWVPDDGEKDAD